MIVQRTITSKLRRNGKVRHFRKEIDIIKDVVVQMRNISHRLSCLNTWSPGGGAVCEFMEPLGGRTSLEKMHQWPWG